jgi:transcriptional regulator with XRE-family HTH domain
MLRQAKHWTQEELAQVSGLSLRTIQRAESDGAVADSTIKSFAAVFEVDAADLHAQSAAQRTILAVHGGTALGMGGAGLGWLIAMISIYSALNADEISGSSAGISAAIVSTLAGLTCAFIGVVHTRYMRRLRQ